MESYEKKILKDKMEKIKNDTLKKWREDIRELEVKGDFMDEDFSNRENMLKFRIMSREKFFLKKIDKTLEKLKKDEYGSCSDCGEEIGMKRLLARPMAQKCIDCKEIEERQEGEVLYEKKSHTLGKKLLSDVQENILFFEARKSEKLKNGSAVIIK